MHKKIQIYICCARQQRLAIVQIRSRTPPSSCQTSTSALSATSSRHPLACKSHACHQAPGLGCTSPGRPPHSMSCPKCLHPSHRMEGPSHSRCTRRHTCMQARLSHLPAELGHMRRPSPDHLLAHTHPHQLAGSGSRFRSIPELPCHPLLGSRSHSPSRMPCTRNRPLS